MDGHPLPPDLKQRVIERGCAYLAAVGRRLDPPEDRSHYAAPRAVAGSRPSRLTSIPAGLRLLRRALSQIFGA